MKTPFANIPLLSSMETIGSLGWLRVDEGALLYVLNAEGTWDRARELPKGDLPRGPHLIYSDQLNLWVFASPEAK